MKSKILGLWVDNYYSGSTTERFKKPLESLGYSVNVIDLFSKGVEAELIKQAASYDYLIHVPYPGSVRLELIHSLKEKHGIKTIVWNGDDEWMFSNASNSFHPLLLSKAHDYTITTSEEAFHKYPESSKVILAQWGYSASDWVRRKVKKTIDVYFCGARNKHRDIYIRTLLDSGVKVVFQGPEYSKSKISLDEMIRNYRAARIGLNFTVGAKNCKEYGQVKARNFEIPAVGTFQLSEHCSELPNYFKYKKEIAVFSSPKELLEKIKYYLGNEEERETIALAGHKRNKDYSYEKIFKRIFEEIEQ